MIKNAKKEIKKRDKIDVNKQSNIFTHTCNESNTFTNFSVFFDKNNEETFVTCNDLNETENLATVKKKKIPFKTESKKEGIIIKEIVDVIMKTNINNKDEKHIGNKQFLNRKDRFLSNYSNNEFVNLSKNRPININININNYTNTNLTTNESIIKENEKKSNEEKNINILTNSNVNIKSNIFGEKKYPNNKTSTNEKQLTFLKIPQKIVHRITSTDK